MPDQQAGVVPRVGNQQARPGMASFVVNDDSSCTSPSPTRCRRRPRTGRWVGSTDARGTRNKQHLAATTVAAFCLVATPPAQGRGWLVREPRPPAHTWARERCPRRHHEQWYCSATGAGCGSSLQALTAGTHCRLTGPPFHIHHQTARGTVTHNHYHGLGEIKSRLTTHDIEGPAEPQRQLLGDSKR